MPRLKTLGGIVLITGLIIGSCGRLGLPTRATEIPTLAYSTTGTDSALDGDKLLAPNSNGLQVVDLTKQQVLKEIPIPAQSRVLGFDISGDMVVWADTRNEKGNPNASDDKTNSDIFVYNLKTGEQKQITRDPNAQTYPKIWQNFIIWQDNRNDAVNVYPGKGSLYLYDLTTGKEQRLTATLSANASYSINDYKVVWEDDRNNKASNVVRGGDNLPANNKDIYGFDIRTGQEFPIATGPRMESKPYIYKDYVVWEDRNSGKTNASIMLYNLSTKQKRQITDDKVNHADPQVYGDYVVWMDERRGGASNDVFVNGKAPNSDIYVFNLKNNTEQLLTGDGPQIQPHISANWVSFVLSRQVGPQVQVVKYRENISGQRVESTVNLTQSEAIAKAKNELTQLGIDFGALKQAQITNDPVSAKESWDIQFAGASIAIEPSTGTVIGISVINSQSKKPAIKDSAQAKKAAQELYTKLSAPVDYKLISIKQSNSHDFWSTVWEKEVIPGVYSKYESVNLDFAADTGKLLRYHLFNLPAKSTEVKIEQSQAIATANKIVEGKGFASLVDAKLEVEEANHYWDDLSPHERGNYCTLVWTVTFRSAPGKFTISDSRASVYVDASNGSVIGGDQTK